MAENRNNEVTFEIVEHIGVIDVIDNREEKWTKEINVVAWNGGKPIFSPKPTTAHANAPTHASGRMSNTPASIRAQAPAWQARRYIQVALRTPFSFDSNATSPADASPIASHASRNGSLPSAKTTAAIDTRVNTKKHQKRGR